MNDFPNDRTPPSVPRADAIKDMALECAAVAREQWAEGSTRLRSYVAREPLQALTIAFGVGVFVGWLAKRR
jgi:hypothetical protein